MGKFILSSLMALLLVAGGLSAQEKAQLNVKQGGESNAQSQGLAAVALAQELAAYGRQQKSPEALAVAAQIILNNPTRAFEGKKEESGQKATEKPQSGETAASPDPAKLLEEAKSLAAGNQTVMALISQVQGQVGEKSRGRLLGPASTVGYLSGGYQDTYTITFRGGELAEVAIVGPRGTDLDIEVFDENGNRIASDTRSSSNCYVAWIPSWTGPFRVVVKNLSRNSGNYLLVTN